MGYQPNEPRWHQPKPLSSIAVAGMFSNAVFISFYDSLMMATTIGNPAQQSAGMAAQMEFDAGAETVGSCRERFDIGLKKPHGSDRYPEVTSK